MAVQWAGIEAAVIAWLKSATGVTSVIYRHQQIPALPYCSVVFDGPRNLGSVDEVRYAYDNAQPNGSEVQQTVVGQREFTVSVQAYSVQERDAGTAKELLGVARTWLSKPSQRALFAAVGASFIDATAVDNLPVLGDLGQGRAHMDVRFRTVDSVIDPVGYIATVNGGPGTSGPSGTYS